MKNNKLQVYAFQWFHLLIIDILIINFTKYSTVRTGLCERSDYLKIRIFQYLFL